MQFDSGWIVAGIATIIGSLSSGIAYVYRGQISDLRSTIEYQRSQIDRLMEVQGGTLQIQEKQANVSERVANTIARRSR